MAVPHLGSRPFEPGDRRTVARLLESARAEVLHLKGGRELIDRLEGGVGAVESRDGEPRLWIPPENSWAVVGTVNAVPVGVGLLRVPPPSEGRDRPVGEIRVLYTDSGCRGVGIGAMILSDLSDRALRQGCHSLESFALPGDRHTKNFFEAAGLVAREIRVGRRL